jgi:hypothetical protein
MERYRLHPDSAAIYFCTFTITDWLPVFVSESRRCCHEQKSLGVDSFVLMPTHLHLIVFDREWQTDRLQKTLNELRRFTGHKLVEHCREAMPFAYLVAFQQAAGDDRAYRFGQATRHPEAISSENFHN